MSRRHVRLATVTLVALAIPLAVAASASGQPAPPRLIVKSSVVIPPYECYSLKEFLSIVVPDNAADVYTSVDEVTKVGLSQPLKSGDQLCGYMGSGTYRISLTTRWSFGTTKVQTVPVYKPNPELHGDGRWDPQTISVKVSCRAVSDIPVEQTAGRNYSCTLSGPYAGIPIPVAFGYLSFGEDVTPTVSDQALFGSRYEDCSSCADLSIYFRETGAMYGKTGSAAGLPDTVQFTLPIPVPTVEEQLKITIPRQILVGKKTQKSVTWHPGKPVSTNWTLAVSVR